jgi:predicted transposase/invertase (TIGR01784 family)
MRTDTIFYQLFQTFNSLLFEILSLPAEEGYQFTSIEVKERAFCLDGIFLPNQVNKPIYFVEVQFQSKQSFYNDFLGEIFLYLSQFNPQNDWKIVAIFAKPSLEPTEITNFQQELIQSGRLVRVYLNQLKTETSIGIAIIQLITSSSQDASQLVTEIKAKISSQPLSRDMMELIEMVLLYKFKNLNRQEIQDMFTLSDLKQTKFYQEALLEGKIEGKMEGQEIGFQKALEALSLLKSGMTAKKVTEITGLTIEQVKQIEHSV